jgi:hypothetical protein
MILENCDDTYLRNQAISGLVYANKSLNRIDEAKKYALMYPEAPETSRESLLAVCLKGDELTAYRQKMKCIALETKKHPLARGAVLILTTHHPRDYKRKAAST